MKPKDTVQALLNDIRNPKTVRDLCVQDVTYVSLNYTNPDLHKIMPWCGTGSGVDAISRRFTTFPSTGVSILLSRKQFSARTRTWLSLAGLLTRRRSSARL